MIKIYHNENKDPPFYLSGAHTRSQRKVLYSPFNTTLNIYDPNYKLVTPFIHSFSLVYPHNSIFFSVLLNGLLLKIMDFAVGFISFHEDSIYDNNNSHCYRFNSFMKI